MNNNVKKEFYLYLKFLESILISCNNFIIFTSILEILKEMITYLISMKQIWILRGFLRENILFVKKLIFLCS